MSEGTSHRAAIDQAIDEHQPSHVFALFSGGHDSLCSTHVAAQHPSFSGVCRGIRMTGSQECVACGRPCPPNRRWCSLSCYYAEDGYPDDDRDEAEDDEDA